MPTLDVEKHTTEFKSVNTLKMIGFSQWFFLFVLLVAFGTYLALIELIFFQIISNYYRTYSQYL